MARRWYVLRVQSGREERAREGVDRRIREAGLSHVVSKVIVPTETITEMKQGKKRVRQQKLYPGYVVVEMDLDDDPESADEAIYLVRETPGVSDFIGMPGRPVPMPDEEVDRIFSNVEAEEEREPELVINLKVGQKVKIKDGDFEGYEGEVKEINAAKGIITVEIDIFGRRTPLDVEYWQLEAL